MRHLLVPKKLLQLLITTFLNCCYLVSRDHLDVARTRVRTGAILRWTLAVAAKAY